MHRPQRIGHHECVRLGLPMVDGEEMVKDGEGMVEDGEGMAGDGEGIH